MVSMRPVGVALSWAIASGWILGAVDAQAGCPVPDLLNPHAYTRDRDVRYDTVDGVELRADLYRPSGPGPHSGVVLLHGGGWMIGGPELLEGVAQHLARQGLVVMNAHYRLLDRARMRGIVRDAVCAMRWMNAHAADYGVAPGCAGVGGDSAGGHLAAMVALGGDDPRFLDGCDAAGDATADVAFAMPLYGINDWSVQRETYGPGIELWWKGEILEPGEDWRAYSPIERAGHEPKIDFFLSHGRKDDLAEVEMSLNFARALEAAGHRVTLQIIDEAKHGYFSWAFYLTDWGRLGQSAMDRFLRETLSRPRP
ncbi:MAG: alpha/beta hydrolase [Myxococcales bacterium]|nr:alpha/beta hydrolase [Myxococcales bacterium]